MLKDTCRQWKLFRNSRYEGFSDAMQMQRTARTQHQHICYLNNIGLFRSPKSRWNSRGFVSSSYSHLSQPVTLVRRFPYPVVPTQGSGKHATSFSTTTSVEDSGSDGSDILGEVGLDFDVDFESLTTIVPEDDSNQHLITNLYPGSQDPVLMRILSARTIERVLGAVEVVPDKHLKPEHCSQAFASLWDIQKMIFQIGSLFDPERDFAKKSNFAKELIQNSTFKRIVKHVKNNVAGLEDEPLSVSLLSLKKLDIEARSPVCQALIAELCRRKSTITLPAISRLCVVLRNEGIYGSLILVEFLPRLAELIQGMDSQELRLVSIALRNLNKTAPPSLIQMYHNRLAALEKSQQLVGIDPTIYCKVILCLNDTKWIHALVEGGISAQELIRQVGHYLAPKVKELPLMDILSLQRILEYSALEPPSFIEALNQRIARLIEEQEETPRLDLISCLTPTTRRSVEQRKRLASFIHHYLDSYSNFEQVYQLLLKILKVIRSSDDELLYNKFWDKATQIIALSSSDSRKALKISYDYFCFNYGVNYSYRNIQFEAKAKQLLYFYVYNYINQQQPTLLAPSDFGKAYAFLIAFSWHAEPIFQENPHKLLSIFEEKFARALRPLELLTMGRGISASLNYQGKNPRCSSRYFDQIMGFSSLVEASIRNTLERRKELVLGEVTTMAKTQAALRRASDESDLFRETVSLITKKAQVQSFDSREGKDVIHTLTNANYNIPALNRFLLDFIKVNPSSVSVDFAQKFLSYAYAMGLEPHSVEDLAAFQTLYDIIDKYWDTIGSVGLIHACLALSFSQCLQLPLVRRIFSVEFLNRLDEEIKFSSSNSGLRIRKSYMELNRAVCLDTPGANVPWFHQKYCESFYSNYNHPEGPLEAEVYTSLTELLGDAGAIQKNVYTPYYYLIDFLIEFDKSGKPIKKNKPKRLISLHNLRSPKDTVEVGESVGLIVLPLSAYTAHTRSLKGYYILRKRHLEMLGYRVIQIDPQHWNSMYMTELAKAEYLESAIFDKKEPSGPLSHLNFV